MSESKLYLKDSCFLLEDVAENSIDAVITDPPYGINLMGLDWDKALPPQQVWDNCFKVLKPGAYCLSFSHVRVDHRIKLQLEKSGFVIKDTLCWCYATGFPNSPEISKEMLLKGYPEEECLKWKGYSKRLKIAWEPIIVSQKPIDGTYAENCFKWNVGPINIDNNRIPYASEKDKNSILSFEKFAGRDHGDARYFSANKGGKKQVNINPIGRWPANVMWFENLHPNYDRFFLVPKPSLSEKRKKSNDVRNTHSTVKPIELMERLIMLFTPKPSIVKKDVIVLDPFCGSGTTLIAAFRTGRLYIGYEKDQESYTIATKRLAEKSKCNQPDLGDF